MECLSSKSVKDMRNLVKGENLGFENFLYELNNVLKETYNPKWEKRQIDELTLNEVWEQKLGVIKYHKTTHTFSCMYVPNQGVAISKHSHNQLVHNGKNIKKTRELYIFYVPSKILEMKFCRKDETHELCNNYGEPVYVISVKITGRAL